MAQPYTTTRDPVNGREYSRHRDCGGSVNFDGPGRVWACLRCAATGLVEAEAEPPTCRMCNGSGKSNVPDRSYPYVPGARVNCSWCSGTGRRAS